MSKCSTTSTSTSTSTSTYGEKVKEKKLQKQRYLSNNFEIIQQKVANNEKNRVNFTSVYIFFSIPHTLTRKVYK